MMTLRGMKDRIDTDTLKHDVIYFLYYRHKVSFDAANAMRYNQYIYYIYYIDRYNLVGGFNPSEKY
jgi:hypothetical protein